MSAEPPDSRGMGWAWKCLNMSDTVWNHKWWTWHCPFSFTDKRKCWEGEGRERRGERTLERFEIQRNEEGEINGKRDGKKKTQHRKTVWATVNVWNRQTKTEVRTLSGRRLSLWEQSDRMPRLTPEEETAADTSSTLPAGRMWCAGIMLHKRTQNVDITASFPGPEPLGLPWAAVAAAQKCHVNKPEWI